MRKLTDEDMKKIEEAKASLKANQYNRPSRKGYLKDLQEMAGVTAVHSFVTKADGTERDLTILKDVK